MKKAAYNIMPGTEEILKTMGEQIKLARLRRDLSVELVSERAGISRSSLWKVESGNPAVAMGIYAAVEEEGFTEPHAPRGRKWRKRIMAAEKMRKDSTCRL